VRAYVDASEAFVRYAIGGEGWHEGILGASEGEAEVVSGVRVDGESDEKVGGNDVWKVHVAPDWKQSS